MLSGASQYLVWTHLIKDFPVNLLSLGTWPRLLGCFRYWE